MALLRESFVARHLEEAKGMSVYGHKLTDLSKDELMACIQFLCERNDSHIRDTAHERKCLFDVMKARRT